MKRGEVQGPQSPGCPCSRGGSASRLPLGLHLCVQSSSQRSECRSQNLESLVAQNTTGPIFYPRLYHLMAYVCLLMGDGQNCDLFLSTALRFSESQGNTLEKCWLNMSQEWWYSTSEGSEGTEDQWLQTVLSLPSWEKIASGKVSIQDVQRNKFLMRVNILDNPF